MEAPWAGKHGRFTLLFEISLVTGLPYIYCLTWL